MWRKILATLLFFSLSLSVGLHFKDKFKSKRKFNQQVTGVVDFRDVCSAAVRNEEFFAQFKRHPIYTLFFENITQQQGHSCLALIKAQAPDLLAPELIEKYQTSDTIGGPTLFPFEQLGNFSPATLRYVKIAADLQNNFGSLEGMHIIEIGVGYGGLCKIIHDIATPASYTLVDHPEALALAKKNLAALGLTQIHYLTPENVKKHPWDLIISDYGFTESSKKLQERYLSYVFAHTPRGYLACNFFAKHYCVSPLSKETVLKKLRAQQSSLRLAQELPETGPENFIAIWGSFNERFNY